MATFLLLAQLLSLGTLVVSQQTEMAACPQLGNATEGSFEVQVTPEVYQPNRTYLVTIPEGTNSSAANASTAWYVLQALSPWDKPLGQWTGVTTANCSNVDMAVLKPPQNRANWTSPGGNVTSAQIRAYIIFPDKPAEFRTRTLRKAPSPSTAPSTTPNSVSTIRSSSLFVAALQLPLLLATGTLLS